MGRFPASRKRIFITHLPTKAWIQSCSQPDSLERYFTKVGYGMSATGEDDHLIFPQKFSSSDYLFFYSAGDNSVAGLIQTTLHGADTPEDCMPN